MIKILCILIVLIKSKLTKEEEKYIKIPFKTQQSEITKNNLIPKLLENEIYIEIEVGSKLQKIPIYIKFDSYIFFLSGSELSNPYFNEKLSETFKINETKSFKFPYQYFSEGYISNDTIKINDKEIKEFNFILGNKLNKNYKIYSGQIGLRLNKNGAERDNNLSNNCFIKTLMKLNEISTSDFTFNYFNNTNGEFIIGSKPDVYDSNYKNDKFISFKGYNKSYDLNWKIIFDNFYFGNYSEKKIETVIEIEFGLMLCPDYIFDNFIKYLFSNFTKNNTCQIQSYQAYEYIICNKDFDVNSIGNLFFEIKSLNTNFTFNSKSLFYNVDDIKLFVFITRITNNYWKFGKPFFQTFNLTFNYNNKTIGFYQKENKNKNKGSILSTVFIIILFIIIFFVIGFLIYYFFFNKKDNIDNQVEELYSTIGNTNIVFEKEKK